MTALRGIAERLESSRLYLCTDARERQGDFAEFVKAAAAGGVDLIQLRDKQVAPERLVELVGVLRDAVGPYQPLIVVNDSAEIAGTSHADVLHIGQDDGAAAKARRHLHQWAKIGRSTHDPDQIRDALDDRDIDYFAVGPVWATPTKPTAQPVSLDLVRHAVTVTPPFAAGSKPWFAIGGINADNLEQVLDAGARRVCVVRAICDADDPQEAARVLKDQLRQFGR